MIFEKVKGWVSCLAPDGMDRLLNKKNGTLMDGVLNIVISSIVPAATILMIFIVQAALGITFSAFGGLAGLAAGGMTGTMYILIGAVYAIAIIILSPVGFLLSNSLDWVMARILGGKGKYSDQAFYESHLKAGSNILAPALILLAMIPCLGTLVSIGWTIYTIFLKYKIIKKVHSLSTLRAIGVIIIPIILIITIVLALVILLYGMLFASLLGLYGLGGR
jgi:hypothetical protein